MAHRGRPQRGPLFGHDLQASARIHRNGTANVVRAAKEARVVTEASPPRRFTIETDARLDRKRGKPWEVQFEHRYDIEADGDGARIVDTETIRRLNYVPYWLNPLMRPSRE